MSNYHTKKLSLRLAEVSIQKFNETNVPHHLGQLQNHRANIEKCLALGDWDKIKREQINATRAIKQLKSLLIDMDALRGRIVEQDVARYDSMIRGTREKALAEINAYLQINLGQIRPYDPEDPDEVQSRQTNYSQPQQQQQQQSHIPELQTDFNLSAHQLQSRAACLHELETLHRDLQDLHGIFHQLHQTVETQGETVTQVEKHVEQTQIAVVQGESSLRQALRYKKAMYPMAGALIGTCLGGPIGMVAGLKAGGLAAIGCGLLGFTGGSAIKNSEQAEVSNSGREDSVDNVAQVAEEEESSAKKTDAERKKE